MSEEEFDLDFLPDEPLEKKKNVQKINTGVYNVDGQPLDVDVPIQIPPQPAPVFHDTPIENQIDDELQIQTANLRNLTQLWKAVRTVDEGIKLARASSELAMSRRKLANKQLGSADSSSKGNIFTIKD